MFQLLTSLMDRLSLTRKFAVVGLLFAISTIFLTYMLYAAAQGNIDFARQERQGVAYIAPLPGLLDQAQRFRDQQHRAAVGDKNARPADLRSGIEQALASVQALDNEMGTALKSSDGLKAVQSSWQALRDAPVGSDSVAKADKFVESIGDFLANVCDSSNLSLDPDLDSYSVMLAVCTDLPTLLTHQGKQRDLAIAALLAQKLDKADHDRLIELRPLAQASLESAHGNLSKAFNANAEVKTALEAQFGNLDKAHTAVVASLRQQVLADTLAGNPTTLAGEYDGTLGQGLQLAESGRKELDRLLQVRINKFGTERNGYVGLALVVMVVVVLLFVAMYRSIVGQLREALGVAEAVAAGDLTRQIDTSRSDELGQLMKALKAMNDGLVQIVGDIRTSVETINTAAQEIATGNIDLSQRTEEQAASLEETAASMEELTSTVKQNAENALNANKLAEGASGIAHKGGEVVDEVVNTMASINESSKKIVDIIGVIDGIAFQTNILALNAAVEAARAGEQGRGFAVVAGEVRSLAQRSAAAAKEIKTLIGDSVNRVTEGTAQVDRAGDTMDEVVGSIRKVTQIMSNIASASSEQSAGIEQVNTAVSQMEETTQQNAALVEEAAAAASAMQDQARSLMEAVNRFKINAANQLHSLAVHTKPVARPTTKVPTKPAAKAVHTASVRPPLPAKKQDDDDWSEF